MQVESALASHGACTEAAVVGCALLSTLPQPACGTLQEFTTDSVSSSLLWLLYIPDETDSVGSDLSQFPCKREALPPKAGGIVASPLTFTEHVHSATEHAQLCQ